MIDWLRIPHLDGASRIMGGERCTARVDACSDKASGRSGAWFGYVDRAGLRGQGLC